MKLILKTIALLLVFISLSNCNGNSTKDEKLSSLDIEKQLWTNRPQNEWPQITMINHINYIDVDHQVAGCGFLLDIGTDTIAVTAKHILTYFKSNMMKTVSFSNSLRQWTMYPKNNSMDKVYVGEIINENPNESLERIPVDKDWLLLSVKQKSLSIQPLQFRESPLIMGEKVYIIGWRYTDNNCTQRIYEGKVITSFQGSIIISTKSLAENKVPGLSGSPVIDSGGYLIGIMSQKYGKMERLSSIGYPKEILSDKNTGIIFPEVY
jgi:hypothetical protein